MALSNSKPLSAGGPIEHLVLVLGHPMLVNAARDAVVQWRYKPTLLNGTPVEVMTPTSLSVFTLSQKGRGIES